jgi:hypothetical protein
MKIEKCLSNCFHGLSPNMSEDQREQISLDICFNPDVLKLFVKTTLNQGVSSDQAINTRP